MKMQWNCHLQNVTYDVQVSLGELQSSEHVTSISKAKTREKKNLTFNFKNISHRPRLAEKIFCSPSTTLRSFGSPDHFGIFDLWNAYRSWFAGVFFAKKWPVFQVKNLTLNKNLWHLCKYYMNAKKLKKKKKNLFSERHSLCTRLSDTLPTAMKCAFWVF